MRKPFFQTTFCAAVLCLCGAVALAQNIHEGKSVLKKDPSVSTQETVTLLPEAAQKGDTKNLDLGDGVKLELVWVPRGTFEMGSHLTPAELINRYGGKDANYAHEFPLHTVKVEGFWLGKYEVTQEQYQVVIGRNPSRCKGPKNPVENVSWNDATDFCRKLNNIVAQASSPAFRGGTFRLPTEAEWEYACRAGSRTRFCFGDSDSGLGSYAWYDGNSGRQTHPVGQKEPNAWGLYDMHGNVWEWCADWADWYDSNYYAGSSRKNPIGPSSGECRVLRGGSWGFPPSYCRSADRYGDTTSNTGKGFFGFRVVVYSFGEAQATQEENTPSPTPTPPPVSPTVVTVSLDLGGEVYLEMVYLEGGTFQMGAPVSELGSGSQQRPVHAVELDCFYIGKYEITQEQYQAVMGTNPSKFRGEKNPVDMVSWNDATEFCRKLNDIVAQASSPAFRGGTFRLPTEAEWEYACRAGTNSPYCFGDSDSVFEEYGWAVLNSGLRTHPVGQKRPNTWGLYDMHGNIWEWCSDWYGAEYYATSPAKNPQGPPIELCRVLRGGSFGHNPGGCRSAARGWSTPADPASNYGFRVVFSH